ncbi:MAG: sn-glycerol-3-phosphate ABC transporter ATP-binding protein UgpC [Phycisphaeraceae bacterium]|nr:sn-glycerol-3-phosphate ABC transporter ATP-binding protein UgpC [Phycisphaeraceae bacterium]
MATVTLENVSKTYPGGVAAVRDISLSIPDDAFCVLVGPSGCGKSTTLRMIAGLEDATEGTISIGGRVVNDVQPKDRDIAMVFQNYALYPHMTVYKNMAFALKLRRIPRAEIDRRVREAARTLDIEHVLDRKPAALSGGQRQRVALGRAMVRVPKVFLFDEPLSNLDAKLRLSTRAELKALHMRLKTTTVYVTHDQEEAMTLGDIVVVMSNGVIQQAGPPLEVYHRPVNRFVASFIGMPPMNFLPGTVSDGAPAAFTEQGAGGQTIALGDRFGRVVRDAGAPVWLAFRPTALGLSGTGDSPGFPVIRAVVDVVEPLGDQVDLFCTTPGGTRIIARIATTSLPVRGDPVGLAVDLSKAHLFDAGEFGANLTLGS